MPKATHKAAMALCLLALCAAPAFALFAPPAERPSDTKTTASFTGIWVSHSGGDRFTLTLLQDGDALTGYHAATSQNGLLSDAVSDHEPPSLTGTVRGPIVIIRFRSGYKGSSAYGHARLVLRDRYLTWQVTDASGEYHLPQQALMMREER